jgi:hypothetical protein
MPCGPPGLVFGIRHAGVRPLVLERAEALVPGIPRIVFGVRDARVDRQHRRRPAARSVTNIITQSTTPVCRQIEPTSGNTGICYTTLSLFPLPHASSLTCLHPTAQVRRALFRTQCSTLLHFLFVLTHPMADSAAMALFKEVVAP